MITNTYLLSSQYLTCLENLDSKIKIQKLRDFLSEITMCL